MKTYNFKQLKKRLIYLLQQAEPKDLPCDEDGRLYFVTDLFVHKDGTYHDEEEDKEEAELYEEFSFAEEKNNTAVDTKEAN